MAETSALKKEIFFFLLPVQIKKN